MKIKHIFFFITAAMLYACQGGSTIEGDRYFEQKNYKKAIEAYNEYLKLHPRHVKTIYNRGRCYQELGEYDKALEDFNKVVKLDPKNKHALLSIGQEMYRRGNYKMTKFYCENVLERDPNDAMAHYLLARAYHKSGSLRDALQHYNKASNIDPTFGEVYYHRSAIKFLMKQKKAACADLQKAVNLKVEGAKKAYQKNCR